MVYYKILNIVPCAMQENLVIYLSIFNVGIKQLYNATLSLCFREDKGISRNKKIILSREPCILSPLSTLPLAVCVIPGMFFNLRVSITSFENWRQ